MRNIRSLHEIIVENLNGKWCDGLAMIDVSDKISIDNIFNNNEKNISINNYPIPISERAFFEVTEMNYQDAIREFNANDKNIISPKVRTDEIVTFDGTKCIAYGGNVYSHTKDNQIIVNDKHYFDNFDEIIEFGFINEKEKQGKWLVF